MPHSPDFSSSNQYLPLHISCAGAGAAGTTTACLLFAIINPSTTFWGYGFVAICISVMGPDFVFSAGTLFIAKFALPHEQSMFGALFNTMTQVRFFHSRNCSATPAYDENHSSAGYRCWCHGVNSGFPSRRPENWPGRGYSADVQRCSVDVLRFWYHRNCTCDHILQRSGGCRRSRT